MLNQKHLFEIPEELVYLNCAYMSPALKAVKSAALTGLNKRSNPWDIIPGDWFDPAEALRHKFAPIINSSPENIALIPSASYGLAIAANNMHPARGQEILLLDKQYPSNVYAWHELAKKSGAVIKTIIRLPNQTWTEAILQGITRKTAVLAIPNCHWTDGRLIDLEQVGEEARRVGAKLVIDGSQSIGAYPFDINKVKPDFLITVGYKWLMGAYGLSYLYASEQYCQSGVPIEYPWPNKKGSEDFRNLVNYTDVYKSGARRFDAGAFPNFIHIPMAIAGLKQVLEWGVEHIQETIGSLTQLIEQKALAANFETPPAKDRVKHIIGVNILENQVDTYKERLANRNIHISFRGPAIRVSPHLYNTTADVDKLFEALDIG